MGKKPLLGLVGLCVGLTLSGCKDCGCLGWGARKEPGPPTARVQKRTTTEQTVSETPRARTITDKSVANKGVDPVKLKPANNFPKDSYTVPPQQQEIANKLTDKNVVDTSSDEEKVLAEPRPMEKIVQSPIAPTSERKTVVPMGDEDLVVPKQPMSHGPLGGHKEVIPVESKKVEEPTIIKEVPSAKKPVEAESTVTIPAPQPPAPPATFKEVPAPMPEPAPRVESPKVETPKELPGGPDLAPPSAPSIAPPSAPPVAPPSAPQAVPESSVEKSGPDIDLPPPPPVPPAPGK